MEPTTTLWNRTDPQQPTDAEIYDAARAAIDHFGGDLGRARSWAIQEAIRFDREGDRRRNLVAVRLQRAIKEITRTNFSQAPQ
jgi:hypothetical protein